MKIMATEDKRRASTKKNSFFSIGLTTAWETA